MAESDARNYLLVVENDKAAAAHISKETAQKLKARQTTLLEVVQSLGEYMLDEDSRIRSRAVSYLSAVVSALPPKFLSLQQIDVLCQFFSDRVEDTGSIEGLMKLQALDRFTGDMTQRVVRAVFETLSDLRSRPQSTRHHVLLLLSEFMLHHRKALRMMGGESLAGMLNLFNAEKDPRNLMLVFSMCRVLMLEWDISTYEEALFDSVYAYFPITFRPPPNDPYGITAQDLKNRLRDCISSTQRLAPFAIPNLLDKLDSTSPVVKKDVLGTFTACAKSYDAKAMSRYSITLWDALKFEVLNSQEPELAEEALATLREIAVCLSASDNPSTTTSPLAQYLRPINKECIEHLNEPAQRQAKAAGDILKAVSSASQESFHLVIKAVVAPMITVYQSSNEIAKRRPLLETFNQLLDSGIGVFGSWHSQTEVSHMINPLQLFSDKLVEIFGQALMGTAKGEVSFRVSAAYSLQKTAISRNLLQDSDIGLIIRYFDDIVLSEQSTGRDDLKKAAMESLAEICKQKPRLIMEIAFPSFMAQLPDTDSEAEARGDYLTTLEGLAEISVEQELFETLVRRILSKLDVLLMAPNFTSPKYASALLSTLLYIMERKGSDKNADFQIYYDRIVIGLTSKANKAALEDTNLTALNDVAALELLGRLNNLIIRHSSSETQKSACTNVYSLFLPGLDLLRLPQAQRNSSLENLWIVSTWILAAIPRQLTASLLETAAISETVERLIDSCQTSVSQAKFSAMADHLALYINKFLPAQNFDIATKQLQKLYNRLPTISNGETVDTAGLESSLNPTVKVIRLMFTISRALVLRLAPTTNLVLADLVSLLDPTRFSNLASKTTAMGFSTLLAPDAILSRSNSAQIRLLAPQRIFQTLTPLIAAALRRSSPSEEDALSRDQHKDNYLTALSGIISTVPPALLIPELSILLPLLLQSLDLADQRVKIATLETLTTVISQAPSALGESGHILSLVKRLLKIASSASAPPSTTMKMRSSQDQPPTPIEADQPRARQLAVRCLLLMPAHVSGFGSRADPLLQLKKDVVTKLARVLDDPRRDVRKEAVDARGAWLRGVDDIVDDSD